MTRYTDADLDELVESCNEELTSQLALNCADAVEQLRAELAEARGLISAYAEWRAAAMRDQGSDDEACNRWDAAVDALLAYARKVLT